MRFTTVVHATKSRLDSDVEYGLKNKPGICLNMRTRCHHIRGNQSYLAVPFGRPQLGKVDPGSPRFHGNRAKIADTEHRGIACTRAKGTHVQGVLVVELRRTHGRTLSVVDGNRADEDVGNRSSRVGVRMNA